MSVETDCLSNGGVSLVIVDLGCICWCTCAFLFACCDELAELVTPAKFLLFLLNGGRPEVAEVMAGDNDLAFPNDEPRKLTTRHYFNAIN